MMIKEEMVACFKRGDFPKFHTGKISSLIFPISRKDAHEQNIPHIICRIFAFTPDELYLVQRRALNRRSHPGLFTDSASGHIQYNPDFSYEYIEQEAWRELEEEMGTEKIYGRLLDLNLEEFRSGGCELAYNFVALVKKKCHPDPIETAPESGFRTRPELEQLLESVDFVKTTKKYWKLILSQKYCKKLVDEMAKNQSIDKNLASYQIHHTGPQIDEDQALDRKSEQIVIDKSIGIKQIGAVIGRFQPFHKGHMMLIRAILQEVHFLKIGIGSAQYSHEFDNPFTYEERVEMIDRSLQGFHISRDRYQIFAVMDLHDMERWTLEVVRVLGEFDIFYSNNEWTRQLLKKAGKEVGELMKFDFDLYNGSAIRQLVMQNKSIAERVPFEVNEYLIEIDAFARIRNLSDTKKQSSS
jgi:nicotinamide-nucleotide adenylyltransferase